MVDGCGRAQPPPGSSRAWRRVHCSDQRRSLLAARARRFSGAGEEEGACAMVRRGVAVVKRRVVGVFERGVGFAEAFGPSFVLFWPSSV